MNKELNNRWQSGRTPFDGDLIACDDLLRINELRNVVGLIANLLREEFGNEQLYVLLDWHEHDGYITEVRPIKWEEVLEWLGSNDSMYNARTGDDHVRIGLYPESLGFYFRFYLPDEDDDPEFYPGKWGDFDLSGKTELLNKVMSVIKTAAENDKFIETKAKEYYDKYYAG